MTTKRYIIAALIFSLLAPLNVSASTWMMQSSAETADAAANMPMADMMAHDHDSMMSAEHKQSMMDAHDHDAEECDDYCMSCSSHCSSTAIISSPSDAYDFDRKFGRAIAVDTSSLVYLLYRPPIRA